MHKWVYVRQEDGTIAVYLGDKYPFKVGDKVSNARHNNMEVMKVVSNNATTLLGTPLNQLIPLNNSNKMNTSNSMFSGIVNKYKSQYVPQKEEGVKMSLTGLICVPVEDEYIGIDKDDNLVSFPVEMTIDIPCYSINKLNTNVQIGDIIKNGRSYSKVVAKNADGSLKTLSFTGYTHNKKEVKDFIMNQATTRVLINMFNFDNSIGFNPIFFAMASGESLDVESLMMLSMTPQGKNLFSNAGGGFNPMMLMMLDKNRKEGSNGGMMEAMLMMSMMGGNNPFAQMQNPVAAMNTTQPAQQAAQPVNTSDNSNAQ